MRTSWACRSFQHTDILPELGSHIGKGEALWKSLHVLDGDIVTWIDTDISNIQPRFVYGLLGPLLREPRIQYVKGFYQRPIREGDKLLSEGGGRVTELMARPLINLFFPELSGIIQPLAGEYAGRRALLESVPFYTGYSVEIGLLIDILDAMGISAIGQVDLERRIHRNQPLGNLSQMSYVILQGAIRKLEERHRLELLTEVGRGMKLIIQEKDRFSLEVREIGDELRPADQDHPRLPGAAQGAQGEVSDRPLRVVVAPDSFGGALASPGVADAIAAGWAPGAAIRHIDLAPMADGGEGTLEALCVALGERAERRSVRPRWMRWPAGRRRLVAHRRGRGAFVEMATASGLARLAVEERTPANARVASSRGTGDLLRAALDAGRARSRLAWAAAPPPTAAAACWSRWVRGCWTRPARSCRRAARRWRAWRGSRPAAWTRASPTSRMTIASDVTNTLCGPAGAAATYGPQKGCDEWAVQELDRALLHWGRAVEQATGRSVADQPGAGAAGGTTSALLGFTNAVIRPGVEVVAEAVGLAELLAAADLVITGEGQADEQTLSGKAAMGVARPGARQRDAGHPSVRRPGAGGRCAGRLRRVRAWCSRSPTDRCAWPHRCATPSAC